MCYNIFQKIKVMRMKLKTRLMVAFLTVTVVPMLLIFMAFMGLSSYQTGEIRKNYGLTEPVDILPANSMQIFSRLTESSQEEIREMIDEDPGAFEDRDYLDQLNEETLGKYAYTIVRKGEQIIYEGNPQDSREISPDELPSYGNGTESFEGGIYLDGDSQHLLKQIDFRFPDGEEGSLFLVSNVDELIPEVESMIREHILPSEELCIVLRRAAAMNEEIADGEISVQDIQQMLENGEITAGHARTLLSFKTEEGMRLGAKKAKEGASVRELEALAKRLNEEKEGPVKAPRKNQYYEEAQLAVGEYLNRKVKVAGSKKKGTLQIEFYGEEDLQNLLHDLHMN